MYDNGENQNKTADLDEAKEQAQDDNHRSDPGPDIDLHENADEGSDGRITALQETEELSESKAADKIVTCKDKSKIKRRGLFSKKESVIIRLVRTAVSCLYENLKNGFFGRFFTSYDSLERKVGSCAALSLPQKVSAALRKKREGKMRSSNVLSDDTGENVAVIRDPFTKKASLRTRIVSAFEKSSLLGLLKSFFKTLLYVPMSTYGAALLSLGITTILVQAAKAFIFLEAFSTSGVIIGVMYTLISVMTIFAGDSPLVKYISESKIGSFLLHSVFGVSRETLCFEKTVPKYRLWAFLAGVGLGLMSALLPAWSILGLIGLLIIALGIANNPESGILILVFALPFVSASENGRKIFCAVSIYVFAVWIIKLISGKRRMKFGALEGWTVLFASFVVLTAFVSSDRTQAFSHMTEILCAIIAFFMISGLFTSRIWMDRAVKALTASAFIVSAVGIYEWILSSIKAAWKLDRMLLFRISSVFSDNDSLSVYLCVAFFFSLASVYVSRKKRGKFMSAFTLFSVAVCTVLTANTLAILALAAVFMIYLLIRSKKNTAFVFSFAIVFTVICLLLLEMLPEYVLNSFMSDLSKRCETLYTVVQMAFRYPLSGIGLGAGAFEDLCVTMNSVAPSGAISGVGMLADVMIRMGVVGVLFLVFFIVLVYRLAFSTVKIAGSHAPCSVYVIPAFCAFVTMTVNAVMSCTLSNLSTAFLFWAVAGFTNASRRIVYFECVGIDSGGLDISLPIKSFLKGAYEASNDNSERTDV